MHRLANPARFARFAAAATPWSAVATGLLFAIGLAFWSTIPSIAEKTARFRLLTFVVVTGGLCRLLGVLLGDPPTTPVLIALAMELGVTPVLCFWQGRVSTRGETALTVAFLP